MAYCTRWVTLNLVICFITDCLTVFLTLISLTILCWLCTVAWDYGLRAIALYVAIVLAIRGIYLDNLKSKPVLFVRRVFNMGRDIPYNVFRVNTLCSLYVGVMGYWNIVSKLVKFDPFRMYMKVINNERIFFPLLIFTLIYTRWFGYFNPLPLRRVLEHRLFPSSYLGSLMSCLISDGFILCVDLILIAVFIIPPFFALLYASVEKEHPNGESSVLCFWYQVLYSENHSKISEGIRNLAVSTLPKYLPWGNNPNVSDSIDVIKAIKYLIARIFCFVLTCITCVIVPIAYVAFVYLFVSCHLKKKYVDVSIDELIQQKHATTGDQKQESGPSKSNEKNKNQPGEVGLVVGQSVAGKQGQEDASKKNKKSKNQQGGLARCS